MTSKAAAAAALQRAEEAARQAVPSPRLRRTVSSVDGAGMLLPCRTRSTSSSAAALPWDPHSRKEHTAKFLRASNRLHHASTHLDDRRCYEEMFSSLDRQLAQVEVTRAMISKA